MPSEEHIVPVVRLIRLFTLLKVTLAAETREKRHPTPPLFNQSTVGREREKIIHILCDYPPFANSTSINCDTHDCSTCQVTN